MARTTHTTKKPPREGAGSLALFRMLMLVSVLTYAFIAYINVHSNWTHFRHDNGPTIALAAIAATLYIGAFLIISLWRVGVRLLRRRVKLSVWLPNLVLMTPALIAIGVVWSGYD